jgi:hypothetical protein
MCISCFCAHALILFMKMLDDSTSHSAVGVQMVVNLETNFPISLKFVLNNIQVHLCCIFSYFYVDLIVFFVPNFTFKFIN